MGGCVNVTGIKHQKRIMNAECENVKWLKIVFQNATVWKTKDASIGYVSSLTITTIKTSFYVYLMVRGNCKCITFSIPQLKMRKETETNSCNVLYENELVRMKCYMEGAIATWSKKWPNKMNGTAKSKAKNWINLAEIASILSVEKTKGQRTKSHQTISGRSIKTKPFRHVWRAN